MVVLGREAVSDAVRALDGRATEQFGDRFCTSDYQVLLDSGRWRLGMVFVQDSGGVSGSPELAAMTAASTESVKVLTVANGVVGVLKHDPLRPRIPWGVPAKVIADATGLPATARSARTVRGVLRLCGSGVRASRLRQSR